MGLGMAEDAPEFNGRAKKSTFLHRQLAYGMALALVFSLPTQRAEARNGWGGLAAGIGAAMLFGAVMGRHAQHHYSSGRRQVVARHHPTHETVHEVRSSRHNTGKHHEEEPVEETASSKAGAPSAPPPPASPAPTYSPSGPASVRENVAPSQPASAPAEAVVAPAAGGVNVVRTSSDANAAPPPAPKAADGPGSADLH